MLMLMLMCSASECSVRALWIACSISARRLWHASSEVLLPVQDVKKAGVGISGDGQKLMRDFGLQCAGLVDLSEEANLRMCSNPSGAMPEKWSLASESPPPADRVIYDQLCCTPTAMRHACITSADGTHCASSLKVCGGGEGAGLAGTALLVCTECYGLKTAALRCSMLTLG